VTATVRWGVIGPGGISTGFAEAMRLVDDGTIVAVASRSAERADAFGDRFEIARRYDSYEAIAEDPEIDAVYVGTPHSRHVTDTLMCLEAGKHVLCEKPLALHAGEATTMVEAARTRGLFLMEAIWSRFLPAYVALDEVLASGRIGQPFVVEADFGFHRPFDPTHRLFDPAVGGGGLLDLGIYPLQLCALVLGPPDHIAAEGVLGDSGVDELVAAVLHHPAGALGVIKAALRANLSCTARISGSEGAIDIPAFMHCPTSITVTSREGHELIDGSYEGNGLRFEITEVHRCLAAGLTESPSMTLDETLQLARTMDEIRQQIGLVYPGESGVVGAG
jgi:predicted dehydrogenase